MRSQAYTSKILAVMLLVQICLCTGRSLISSNIHLAADSTQPKISSQTADCIGELCKETEQPTIRTVRHGTPTKNRKIVLNRQKRGDVDVKIAEYMAMLRLRNPNCQDVACGLIQIINSGREKRSAHRQATAE
ncbi:uncharacterized protein [Watersipora subatra]|uniref:uncharacterized protein n=1 Tax=Watersipora subatra TaxID=2589382 RepID=UPI00355C8A78